jgi:FAD/FMN-containing dehydrogenase
MIGNNACGAHSVAWGTTADNVERLEVLLYDGTRFEAGTMPAAAGGGRVGSRQQRLSFVLEEIEKTVSALVIELAQNVVQEQNRSRIARRGEQIPLAHQQSKEREPLLALRPIPAQGASLELDRDVVAMRAMRGESPLEV